MTTRKKHAGGRPTKYKPEYADEAVKLCILGATDAEMADFFGVTEQTFNNWKHQYPEFFESLKDGKIKADANVSRSLYQTAIEGNTTAQIFWLKNRQPRQWRDKQEIDHTTKGEKIEPTRIIFEDTKGDA